jgi:hypothetical protein
MISALQVGPVVLRELLDQMVVRPYVGPLFRVWRHSLEFCRVLYECLEKVAKLFSRQFDHYYNDN